MLRQSGGFPRFLVLAATMLPLTVFAQGGGFFGGFRPRQLPNVDYDGRYTVARIRYGSNRQWSADYPTMERHLSTMLKNITLLDPHLEGSNVHDLDDAELLKIPLAYLTEPGYWHPSDSEVKGLREYLKKGGFLIVDDFHFPEEWAVFEAAIRRVLPEGRIVPLKESHPIFDTFFRIESLEVPYPGRLGEMGLFGEFYGIYEDNEPSERLMVVINYNIDLGDYVEWSDRDVYSQLPTNEAYKFMINYVIYGLTR
jgi:uncharacterized protein DUF4159